MAADSQFLTRGAEPGDAASMGAIHVAAWRHAYRGIMSQSFLDGLDEAASTRYWAAVLSPATGAQMADGLPLPSSFVAIEPGDDQRVVAMSTFGQYRQGQTAAVTIAGSEPTGELWMLNAHPDFFGSGAAVALHRRVVSELAGQGHRYVALWVVEGNTRARRFYEREGWVPGGQTKVEQIGERNITEMRYVQHLDQP